MSRKSNSAPKSEILGVGDEFPCRECPLLCYPLLNSHHHHSASVRACVCAAAFAGGILWRNPFWTASHLNRTHTYMPFAAKTAANRPRFWERARVHANFDRNMRRNKSKHQQQSILGKNLPNLECLQHFGARASRENNGPCAQTSFSQALAAILLSLFLSWALIRINLWRRKLGSLTKFSESQPVKFLLR